MSILEHIIRIFLVIDILRQYVECDILSHILQIIYVQKYPVIEQLNIFITDNNRLVVETTRQILSTMIYLYGASSDKKYFKTFTITYDM